MSDMVFMKNKNKIQTIAFLSRQLTKINKSINKFKKKKESNENAKLFFFILIT